MQLEFEVRRGRVECSVLCPNERQVAGGEVCRHSPVVDIAGHNHEHVPNGVGKGQPAIQLEKKNTYQVQETSHFQFCETRGVVLKQQKLEWRRRRDGMYLDERRGCSGMKGTQRGTYEMECINKEEIRRDALVKRN